MKAKAAVPSMSGLDDQIGLLLHKGCLLDTCKVCVASDHACSKELASTMNPKHLTVKSLNSLNPPKY